MLTVSRLGDLRNDNDANCTYEGENNVLLQQTSNWLIAMYRKGLKSFAVETPLDSVTFLVDFKNVINRRFNHLTSQEALNPNSKLLFRHM